MSTKQQALDKANPSELGDLLRNIGGGLGTILAGLRPRTTARTGLTSQAAHEHSVPGAILSVDDGSAGPLDMITSGSPGAGEVLVEYDADGLATLTFSGAVTAYSVTQLAIPSSLVDDLAATWTGAT